MALVWGFAPSLSPSPGRVWGMLKHMQEVLGLAPPPHPIPLALGVRGHAGGGRGGSRLCTVTGARAEAICHDSMAISQ